ncbi:MAG: hypothetical protein QOD06_2575 [Candidatus Binatota bacterium]|nr:hypothetical protein [Candidatus Binatota bacterium]
MGRPPIGVLAVLDGYRLTGPGKQLLEIARPDADAPFRTSLAIFQRGGEPTPLIRAARSRELDLTVVPDRFPGDPRTAGEIRRLVASADAAILQTHGYKANVLGRFAARRTRKPWLAFLHGETWENPKVRLYFALERWAVRGAARVVVVSREMERAAVKSGIPAGILRVVLNACLTAPDAATTVPSNGGDPVVAVLGRLSPEKGIDLALDVHRVVLGRVPGARLAIAGEGPERDALARRAERLGITASVDWLGYRDDVAEVYRSARVVLMPSRSEGLPNVALEAMAHGVPVVATAVGGVPEVVTDGRSGFVAPSGDVAALAEAVLRLLEAPDLRRRLGMQGAHDVAERFSLAARRRALAEIYGEVA